MKAIFSWTFSGGSTILSVWSVATSRVSIFVVFMEGCEKEYKVQLSVPDIFYNEDS